MRTGDTFADVVVWRWSRTRMTWETTLRDGTVLRAIFCKRGKNGAASYWWAECLLRKQKHGQYDLIRETGRVYPNADAAQKAAFDHWRVMQPKAKRSPAFCTCPASDEPYMQMRIQHLPGCPRGERKGT